ncbi:hypothetical protein GMOD_00008430 [Pyrenophora seminiperda CCB06]|uniref:Uncharacterized protein n=1 Tax=Pyrenophora seminiperda CCB06 TaxID=1302712 RepID=A0A3M7M8E4_9PLEO|nr:hypothetical protein GMOD_00008430 [Pyrenophora seminiperda CCB06]
MPHRTTRHVTVQPKLHPMLSPYFRGGYVVSANTNCDLKRCCYVFRAAISRTQRWVARPVWLLGVVHVGSRPQRDSESMYFRELVMCGSCSYVLLLPAFPYRSFHT